MAYARHALLFSDLRATSPDNYAAVYRAEAERRGKQGITEEAAIESGMQEKKKELIEKGTEVYVRG
jgi:hypothetical protein